LRDEELEKEDEEKDLGWLYRAEQLSKEEYKSMVSGVVTNAKEKMEQGDVEVDVTGVICDKCSAMTRVPTFHWFQCAKSHTVT
jgi:NMD protein affecting ribosome stability and mRNA decay